MKRWKTILAGILAAAMLVPAAAAAPSKPALSDLNGHWAQKEIQAAVADGWVDGYPDGTFKPEKTITRAEFTKMLLDAVHLTPDGETVQWMKQSAYVERHGVELKAYQPKLDDMGSHWLTKQGWMDAALYSGMVVPDDYNNNCFRPEKAIARYEIALMADRAMGLVYPATRPLDVKLDFTDNAAILDWMKGYIRQAVDAGVLYGYPDGSFGPQKTATRAEAVVMVSRTLKYMEEGLSPDLNTVVCYHENGATVQKKADDLRLQVIDGCIYAPLRELHKIQEEIMHSQGSGHTIGAIWNPIQQQLHLSMDYAFEYQAGNPYYYWESEGYSTIWESNAEKLRAPARLLYGEIMVPLYDFNLNDGQDQNPWDSSWDPATKTLTVCVWYRIMYQWS